MRARKPVRKDRCLRVSRDAIFARRELAAEILRFAQNDNAVGLRVVDLGALQAIGIIDVERLPLGVEIESGHARFTMAVAGILDSAEWQMRSAPIVGAFT